MKKYLHIQIYCVLLFWLVSVTESVAQITFTGQELLGKPTNNSITINIIPATTIEYYYEYGTTQGGPYTTQTSTASATGGAPHEIVINGLQSNTHYYYRMQYRTSGGSWIARSEYSFWTQRTPVSTFIFTITSDSHANFNAAHQGAMTNIRNDHPDFNLDLGDTFYPDNTTTQSAVNATYIAYRNPLYMGAIGHSVPIFLSSGNHENEEGWNFDDTPFSIALGSVQARKMYYPTPIPDGFYSGNTDPLAAINEAIYGDEYREDYYAWTWGDALFVVIDPFQYTMNLPYPPVAGEGSEPVTGDQWSWTLGKQQYQWFKQTLENSHATFKFVFSHQMVGGIPRTVPGSGPGYVRGGAEAAGYFEWGGKNSDGTEGFASHRNAADFGTIPIHQLMVQNGVSAYFHGHDHQYVYETRDNIVYQEVPSPSMTGLGFSGIYTEGNYGTYNTIKILPSPGHLRLTVSPSQTIVDYISSSTGLVTYSYTILSNLTVNSSTGFTLTNPMTISGALTFTQGNLYLGNYNLTLSGSVVGAGASHCIVTNGTGGVIRNIATSSSGIFPIGADATHYNPVTLTSDAGHAADNFTVRATAGALNPVAPNNNQAVQVTWDIAEAVVGGSSVIVKLGWNSSQHGALFSNSSASIWHYDAGSLIWQDLFGSAVEGTDPYTLSTASAVSSFSPFAVGNSGALPVEMTSFTAENKGVSAHIRWATATEEKSYNFEIERRMINSSEYAKVGTVQAAGASNVTRTYEFTDANLAPGKYAYRLKMNDNDGSFAYFGNAEISIDAAPKEFSLKGNYPNPFNPSTTIEFTVPQNGHVTLKVYNVIGQQVATLFDGIAQAEQYNKVSFDASKLSSGMYFNILEFNNQRLVRKMLLTK